MLIKTLRMENFRQFKGTTSVSFSVDPKQNVTVILGDNTFGKTTLLQAFNWCFYGVAKFDHNPDMLLNLEIASEMREGDKRIVEVEITVIHQDVEYVISRTQNYFFERGKAVEERQADIDKFFETGVLDTESNVQFGEGGAGTFSDGKLTTNTKDFRHSFILKTFVEFGAPEEILYEAKAHIGTDYLIKVVKNIREEIIRLGGTVLFDSKMTEVISENGTLTGVKYVNNGVEKEIKTNSLILAIGHSARDTFYSLKEQNIKMEQKPFAMGVRIEHKQDFISESQYGKFAKYLPPASYKLVAHLPNGRNVYTFCMCPGGVVVAASSEEERLAVNGMSYFARDKENANSALLVSIQPEDFGTDDVLGGVELQRKIEHSAYVEGGENYNAPVQKVGDFLKSQKTLELGDIKPSYKPAVTPSDFKNIFPDYMYEALQEGIKTFDKQIKGFAQDNAIMTAVESRSSSPVRIVRNTDFNSVSIKGLYPCGEGCGYAGGIMSAATDGLKCGEAVLKGE